jgi:hypothetical protein
MKAPKGSPEATAGEDSTNIDRDFAADRYYPPSTSHKLCATHSKEALEKLSAPRIGASSRASNRVHHETQEAKRKEEAAAAALLLQKIAAAFEAVKACVRELYSKWDIIGPAQQNGVLEGVRDGLLGVFGELQQEQPVAAKQKSDAQEGTAAVETEVDSGIYSKHNHHMGLIKAVCANVAAQSRVGLRHEICLELAAFLVGCGSPSFRGGVQGPRLKLGYRKSDGKKRDRRRELQPHTFHRLQNLGLLICRCIVGTTTPAKLQLTKEERATGVSAADAYQSDLVDGLGQIISRISMSAILLDSAAYDGCQAELAVMFARMRHTGTLGSKRYEWMIHEVGQMTHRGLFGPGRSLFPSRTKVDEKFKLTCNIIRMYMVRGPTGAFTGCRADILGPRSILWAMFHLPANRKSFVTQNPRIVPTAGGRAVVFRGAESASDVNIPLDGIDIKGTQAANRFGPKIPLIASNGADLEASAAQDHMPAAVACSARQNSLDRYTEVAVQRPAKKARRSVEAAAASAVGGPFKPVYIDSDTIDDDHAAAATAALPAAARAWCTIVHYQTVEAARAAIKRTNNSAGNPLFAGPLQDITMRASGDAGGVVADDLYTCDSLSIDSPLSNSLVSMHPFCVFQGIDNATNTFAHESRSLAQLQRLERGVIVDRGPDFQSLVDCGLWTAEQLASVEAIEDQTQTFYRTIIQGVGDGARIRYIMRVGTSMAWYGLPDSEISINCCGLLFPRHQPRAERTIITADGRITVIGFSTAGVLSLLISTTHMIWEHFSYMAQCANLYNLIDEGRDRAGEEAAPVSVEGRLAPTALELCKRLLKCSQLPGKLHEVTKTSLEQLRVCYKHIHKHLYDAEHPQSINLKDPGEIRRFLSSLQSEYTSCQQKYGVRGGFVAAAQKTVVAIHDCLHEFSAAVTLESEAIQAVLVDDKFVVEWDDQSDGKHLVLQFGEILTFLRQTKADLEGALQLNTATAAAPDAPVGPPLRAAVVEAVKELAAPIIKKCNLLIHPQSRAESFSKLVKQHSGPAFYTELPVPGVMHLSLRTMEKVVNLWGLLLFVLCGSEEPAVEATASANVRAHYTKEARSQTTKKFKADNTKASEYAALSEHAARMAAPLFSRGLPEYGRLVELAFMLPEMMCRILRDPDPIKTYQLTRPQLGQQLVDFGLSLRLTLAALFDDKLIDVASIVQLTVSMPQHFLDPTKNTALALEQVVEAIVKQMKHLSRHVFWGASKVTKMMEHSWAAALSEALHEDAFDARLQRILESKEKSLDDKRQYFRRCSELVLPLCTAYRGQLATDLLAAVAELQSAGASAAAKGRRRRDMNQLLDLHGPAVGDGVEMLFRDGEGVEAWAAGNITAVDHHSETVDVEFDDGTKEDSVAFADKELRFPPVASLLTQPFDAWSYTADPAERAPCPSPYAAVKLLTKHSPPAMLAAIAIAATAELAVLDLASAPAGVEAMLRQKSMAQLVHTRGDLNTISGLNQKKYLRPHGSKVKSRLLVPTAEELQEPGEAALQDEDLAAAFLDLEELDMAFGTEYLHTESALLRGRWRDMVRLDQESGAQKQITAGGLGAHPGGLAAATFVTVALEPDGKRDSAAEHQRRTAVFYVDEDGNGHVGCIANLPPEAAPSVEPYTYLKVYEMQVSDNIGRELTTTQGGGGRASARGRRRCVYTTKHFRLDTSTDTVRVPVGKITHSCHVMHQYIQNMAVIKEKEQQAAKVAVDEHADWEAHQADLAEASRLQQLQPEIHAEATATLEAAARTRAAAHDAPD